MLLIMMHGLSMAGVMFIPIPWPLKIILCTGLTGSLIYYTRRHALLRSNKSIVEVEMKTDCTCAVRSLAGEWQPGSLLATTFITRYMVILNLAKRDTKGHLAVAILADAIDAERFRELRVLLKWKCGKALNRL